MKAFGGFDPVIFVKSVNIDFICSICSLVVRKPKECVGCGSLFCEICIKHWLEKNGNAINIYIISTDNSHGFRMPIKMQKNKRPS